MNFREWLVQEGGKGSGSFSFNRLVKGTFKPARPHSSKNIVKKFINPFK